MSNIAIIERVEQPADLWSTLRKKVGVVGSLGDTVIGAVTAAGGIAGIVSLLNWFSARQASRREQSVDIRRVTDQATATLIANLERHRTECETRMAQLEERCERLEAVIPIFRLRDDVMTGFISSLGQPLPRMPSVTWPEHGSEHL